MRLTSDSTWEHFGQSPLCKLNLWFESFELIRVFLERLSWLPWLSPIFSHFFHHFFYHFHHISSPAFLRFLPCFFFFFPSVLWKTSSSCRRDEGNPKWSAFPSASPTAITQLITQEFNLLAVNLLLVTSFYFNLFDSIHLLALAIPKILWNELRIA